MGRRSAWVTCGGVDEGGDTDHEAANRTARMDEKYIVDNVD